MELHIGRELALPLLTSSGPPHLGAQRNRTGVGDSSLIFQEQQHLWIKCLFCVLRGAAWSVGAARLGPRSRRRRNPSLPTIQSPCSIGLPWAPR